VPAATSSPRRPRPPSPGPARLSRRTRETRYFKHRTALVESGRIGAGTRIWAFAHVLDGAVIGRDCNIGDHCYIESGAEVGDAVTIKNGVAVWDGVTIERGAFLGPSVALINDRRPRSRMPWTLSRTRIGEGATIGANATVLGGLTVGAFALVGAGAVVTRDVPRHGLVYGSPARLRGYVCRCGRALRARGRVAVCPACRLRFVKRGRDLHLAEARP
jgi:acetyltransferase-like isoleucine patch superfamily enzyme